MSETIPLERMRPDEIARLKIRYTNRDGSAEVLCSKAWAHIQLQDATIASLRAEVARKDAALEWYASPEAWTADQVEGPNGDYGNRARAALTQEKTDV
jgi:hypothetical protein